MDPFVVLRDEHELLYGVLDSLECCMAGVEKGGDPRDFRRFAEFLRGFLSSWHLAKEDDVLFTAMVRHGFPRDTGALAVLGQEHRDIEQLLSNAVLRNDVADDETVRSAMRAMQSVDALMRYHMEMEETVLFTTAEAELPADGLAMVRDGIQALQEEARGSFRSLSLRRLADRLQSEFLPSNYRRVALGGAHSLVP